MSAARVPWAPLAPFVEAELGEVRRFSEFNHLQDFCDRAGIRSRLLRYLRSGSQQTLRVEDADRIITCGLSRPDLWQVIYGS